MVIQLQPCNYFSYGTFRAFSQRSNGHKKLLYHSLCKTISTLHASWMQSLSEVSPKTLQMSSVNAWDSFLRPVSHLCRWAQAKLVFCFPLPGLRDPQRKLGFFCTVEEMEYFLKGSCNEFLWYHWIWDWGRV